MPLTSQPPRPALSARPRIKPATTSAAWTVPHASIVKGIEASSSCRLPGRMRGRRAVVQLACHTPLAVCDRGDERRLDVAVEHGTCVEVPLWCDADMSCTAREEFCTAFGVDAEQLHFGSVLSCRTIRPSESVASVQVRAQRRVPDAHESNAVSVLDAAAHGMLANLMREVGDIATVICMRYYTGAAEAASLDNKIHFVEALRNRTKN
ncbi:hypothetical protein GGX14DRAFT_605792 [Mycena pura]|uniref:Uncharacterized protein n=1 Tax=Mycena pura TaxID=153505 RepID=A0AAD6UME0_9AGAR|nr:hypothetical protein GGX14DRAFT_605792 [Mycena pura]